MDMDMSTMGPMMDNSTHMKMMDMGKQFMWMEFHTNVNNTILFGFWNTMHAGQMVYSCFIIFALCLFLEFIKYIRWRLDVHMKKNIEYQSERYFSRLVNPYHLQQTILFCIQTIASYFVMLVFMGFSVWLCITIVCGISLGHYLFGCRKAVELAKMMMKMFFHFRIKEPVLFKEWLPGNMTGYVFTCIAVGVIAFLLELLRFLHNNYLKNLYQPEDEIEDCCMPKEYEKPQPQLPFKPKYLFRAFNVLSTVFYFFEMYISYSLMLISMTYNVPIVASMIAGHVVGYFVTGPYSSLADNAHEADCCG